MKIFVATPTYSGQVFREYDKGVRGLRELCRQKGYTLDEPFISYDSLVTRARDRYLHLFLKTNNDRLVWIDSDIGFDPRDVIRLCESKYDFIGGAYPLKKFDFDAYRQAQSQEEANSYVVSFTDPLYETPEGYLSTRYLGTGFMIWSRAVAEFMIEGGEWCRDSSNDKESYVRVFQDPVHAGIRLSEDYHVCVKWTEAGGKVWVDPKIKLSHTGFNTWRGCLDATIK